MADLQSLTRGQTPENVSQDFGVFLANVDDLADGEKKCFEHESETILLTRIDGQFYATSPKCTHAGAPLDKGVLSGHRIVCAWHGACFNVKTGDIEEGMVVEPLKTYQLLVADGKIYVKRGDRRLLIVGGGAAGAVAVETLRSEGFLGQITLLTAEDSLPYDMTKCSKMLARGPLLRNAEFYQQKNIDVRTGCKVVEMDAKRKRVTLEGGEVHYYDAALVCTGSEPRKLGVEGEDSEGVFMFRSAADADRVRAACSPEKRHVVIGKGILGMELAAAIKVHMKAEHVCVIDSGNTENRLRSVYGPSVFETIMKLHEENGVILRKGPTKRFVTEDGKVTGVEIGDGTVVPCDLVIVCIGKDPRTEFLKGVQLHDDKSLEVDEHCRVIGAQDLFSAGDMVTFPVEDSLVRIEHWGMAMQQGRVAALNMLGKKKKYECTVVFWTNQFGKNFRFCGIPHAIKTGTVPRPKKFFSFNFFSRRRSLSESASGKKTKETSPQLPSIRSVAQIQCLHKDVVVLPPSIFCASQTEVVVESTEALVVGTVGPAGSFTAYCALNQKIVGVSSYMADPIVAASAELMRSGLMPSLDELRLGANPVKILEEMQRK